MIENKTKTNIGVWIFLSILLIVGLTIYNNNQANERQQKVVNQEAEQKVKVDTQDRVNDIARTQCLDQAEQDYQKYIELNATGSYKKDSGIVYTAPAQVWEYADSNLESAKNDCYRQYPAN